MLYIHLGILFLSLCRKRNGEDATLTRPEDKWAERCLSDLIRLESEDFLRFSSPFLNSSFIQIKPV